VATSSQSWSRQPEGMGGAGGRARDKEEVGRCEAGRGGKNKRSRERNEGLPARWQRRGGVVWGVRVGSARERGVK